MIMAITPEQKEKIAIEVMKTLVLRFETFPQGTSNNRNAPFHEAFLKAFSDKIENHVSDIPFFISLSSWLQGLNTTLGQAFFEKVAHILCDGEKREYTSKKLGNLKITQTQQGTITQIINNLSTSSKHPNLQEEDSELLKQDDSSKIDAADFSVDVFVEKSDKIVAIEMKTVNPNSGEMKGEKQKILTGKAALFHEYPNKKIIFFFGFPFDPTVDRTREGITGYNKERFLKSIVNAEKFCALDEFLVASELWDFLSGEANTMEMILEIINQIATPDFQSKLRLLYDKSKRTTVEYIAQLTEWNLFSERELVMNDTEMKKGLTTDRLTTIYYQIPFKTNGGYNWERYNVLRKLF